VPPVPPVGGANAGAVNSAVGVALGRVASSPAGQIQGYQDQITRFKAALDDLGPRTDANAKEFDTLTNAINVDGKAIEEAGKKTETHVNELTKQAEKLIANTAAQNDLAAAYGRGAAAVDQVLAKQEAEKQLITDGLIPGTQKYNAALAQRIQLVLQDQQATGNASISKQVADQDRTTAAQLAVNAAYDGTAQSITHAQDVQKAYTDALSQHLIPGTQEFSDAVDKLASAYDRGAEATSLFQQEQSSVQALTSALGNAFDQLGQGIVNAFLSGSGQAVNFGNIVRSVIGSIATDLVKLAVVNPVLNGLTGGNNPTLGAALGVLGGGGSGGAASGGGGSGIGSLFSVASNVSSLGSITDALGLSNIGGTLGLTGPNGILSSLGLGGNGGLLSGVGSFLGTPLFGSGALTSATTSALSGLGAGVYGPASLSSVGLSGLTVGTLLGGAGLGFGAGSLLDSLLGAKNQTAGTIGSGVGGLAGAAIGSIIPGVGTVIGGLLGGLLGGGAGFLGPGPKNPFTSTAISIGPDGLLNVGNSVSQITDPTGERSGAMSDAGTLNGFLQSNGLRLASIGTLSQIGSNGSQDSHSLDPSKYSNIGAAFGGFQFSASDPTLNNYLTGKSFGSLGDLQTVVGQYNTLINSTIPALTKLNVANGSFNDQIAAVTAQFAPAIAAAQQFGVATDSLTDAENRGYQAANDAANNVNFNTYTSLTARFLTAKAQVTGNPADSLTAQLDVFDTNANQQRTALDAQLKGLYGDTVTSTGIYAEEMAQLEQTLGEERLAIQTQANAQILQAAQSAITSLDSFATGLQVSAASPLSPQDQRKLASNQFQKDVTAAASGDLTAYGAAQTDASAFLSASRTVNGSGAGYVSDFQSVMDGLRQLANVTPDTLTSAVLQSEMRTQTQQLQDSLSDLGTKLDAIRAALGQAANTPAQLVA
jgi:hypothetical protein